MTIEAAFVQHVLANSAVRAAIGSRFFSASVRQGLTLPYAAWFDASEISDQHTTAASGYVEKRVQIDCYGRDQAEAKRVADAISEALDPTQAFQPWGSFEIDFCLKENEFDSFGPPNDGSDRGDYRIVLEFTIAFQQA